jgi:uncharacterized membrane protein
MNIKKTTLALSTLATLLLVSASPAPLFAADVSTSQGEATPAADQNRSLGNKRSGDFKGYSDTAARNNANTFTTTIDVSAGQAWPRISEGLTTGQKTPGFGGSVDDYIKSGNRYLSYTGTWDGTSTGNRYNGAYIWTNNANNFVNGDPNNPRWPYTTEINIWNRGTAIPSGTTPFPDYYDNDGKYKVSGKLNTVDGVTFYSYYFILQGGQTSNMTITTNKILKHLRDNASLDGNQRLIEISVAAEGHAGSKGKFTANITSMGRP